VGRMVEAQVKTGLEAVEKVLSDVAGEGHKKRLERAKADGAVSQEEVPLHFADYWDALLEKGPSIFSKKEDPDSEATPDSEEGSSTPAVEVESRTTLGMKGIVRTTVTQPSNGSAEPSETVLAIGGGAQLFPGLGGPYDEDEDEGVGVLQEARRDVEEAVLDVVGGVRGAVEGVVDGAVRARKDLENAETRERLKEREERRKEGWRSQAFDW